MQQKYLEKFAFLYLCGQRDRDILSGKERMRFEDFDRLIYLTEYLGFQLLSLEIWNQFSQRFKSRFKEVEQLIGNHLQYLEYLEDEDGMQIPEQWIAEFYASVPDQKARECLESEREGGAAYVV